jgi:hypothetical protein
MKPSEVVIWTCGAVLCFCLFWFITPVSRSVDYFEYEFSPKLIAILSVGWAVIITVCAFLAKLTKKR